VRRRVVGAAALDVVAILLFVAVGRRSHGESGSWLIGTGRVAAPFLIGLALAWLAARAWRAPTAVTTGVAIWPVVVAAGMALRHFAFDRGTALPFVIVATGVTGLFLIGWRAATSRVLRSRL